MVCAKMLYNYINHCLLKVQNIDLPLQIKHPAKRQRDRKNRRLFETSIEERPEAIQTREKFGHWEINTIVGTIDSSAVLFSMNERQTRQRHIIKITSRTADTVGEGIQRLNEKYGEKFSLVFHSITYDNGSEFASLPQQLPDIPIYYVHPPILIMREGQMKSRMSSFTAFSQKEEVLINYRKKLSSMWKTGSTIFPVNYFSMFHRNSFFKMSYLIL